MSETSKNARNRIKYKNFRARSFYDLKINERKNEQESKKFQNILEEKFYISKEVVRLNLG